MSRTRHRPVWPHPFDGDCAVLVLDGRGERHSHLAGRFCGGTLETLYSQQLPHSLGLLYEDATAAPRLPPQLR